MLTAKLTAANFVVNILINPVVNDSCTLDKVLVNEIGLIRSTVVQDLLFEIPHTLEIIKISEMFCGYDSLKT